MSAFLKTLGGLAFEPPGLSRPKPLLLLAYLALEGPQDRRFLAELFWPVARRRMNNLRVELARIRREAPDAVEADRLRAWVSTDFGCDATRMLALLDLGNVTEAIHGYAGPFCDGVYVRGLGTELEEWLYATREFIGGRVRAALLLLAEEQGASGHSGEAGAIATRAFTLRGAPSPEHGELYRIHALLAAAGSPQANRVAREAREFGLELATASDGQASMTGHERMAAPRPFHRLPVQNASFIGRHEEFEDVRELLHSPHCRLLTLLGPAGVGKTRLALQVARDQHRRGLFADGIVVVSLEALDSAEQLSHAIASALDHVPRGPLDPLEQVMNLLADQRVLLVLDNFEHMMHEAAKVAQLLQRCSGISILVTSRERLGLEGEHGYPVAGLPFPGPGTALDEALASEAVTLFAQRARRVQPHFTVTESNYRDVLEICAIVDGLPLGIELASVWLRAMTCGDIARELRQSLDLLTSRDRHISDRHKSIRGAFETSWNRLETLHRETLRKLAVFRDGFSREAASEIARATIPTLASLVDSSLLRIMPNGRFDRHPLLYQYIGEKLAEAPATQSAVREHHSSYYARLLERNAGGLRKSASRDFLSDLDIEFQNVRAGWIWALEQGHTSRIQAMVEVLEPSFVLQGRHREGLRFFELTAPILEDGPSSPPFVLGWLLSAQARLHQELGDYADAERLAHRALLLFRTPQGDTAGEIRALDTLGRVARYTGRRDEAKRFWEEALDVARAGEDRAMSANQLGNIALLEMESGEDAQAEARYRLAIELNREESSNIHVIRNLNNLAHLMALCGRLEEAEAACEEALALATHVGFEEIVPYVLHTQTVISDDLNDHERTSTISVDVIRIARERGSKSLLADSLTMRGVAATKLGDHELAWRCLREALEVAVAIGVPPAVLTALSGVAGLWIARGRLDAATRLTAFVLHHGGADRHTVQRVRAQRSSLERSIPLGAWLSASERGTRDVLADISARALRWDLETA